MPRVIVEKGESIDWPLLLFDPDAETYQSSEYKLDENPSVTATALKAKEKKLGLKPGDAEWFKLWFSQPFLTGTPTFRGRKK